MSEHTEDTIVIAEADSTTYPFSSPIRRSESVWSVETVPWGIVNYENNLNQEPINYEEYNLHRYQQEPMNYEEYNVHRYQVPIPEPDSTGSPTPDNLSPDLLLMGERIINWLRDGQPRNVDPEENGDVSDNDDNGEDDDYNDNLP